MSLDEWVGHGIPDEVIDLAIVWIAKLDSQNLTEQERQSFYCWLDEDPTHRWAFEELSEIWAKTSLLKDKEHLVEQSRVLHFPSAINEDTHNPIISANSLSYIAIVLILLGVVVPLFF